MTTSARIFCAVFQTGRLSNGGVESITRVLERLPRGARGVTVLTQMETPANERWRSIGAKVEFLNSTKPVGESFYKGGIKQCVRYLFGMVRSNLLIARAILAGDCYLVHCNDPMPFWYVAPACALLGTPLVLNIRDTKPSLADVPMAKYALMFKISRCVLLLSDHMRSFYMHCCPDRETGRKLTRIYSAIDLKSMVPLAASEKAAQKTRLGLDPNRFTIGYVATFNDKKNQLGFINNTGLGIERMGNATVCFLGDFDPVGDPYAKTCGEAAKAVGAQVFDFRGCVTDMGAWYAAFDVVVVPTRQEGLARCMIESLACGVPVVSFDVASAEEILVGHDCGRVVRQGDYASLLREIQKMAADPEERARLGQNGRRVAETLFQEDKVGQAYENLYRGIAYDRLPAGAFSLLV